MGTDENGVTAAWRAANSTFLAPFVAFPSLGLAAVNATVGATARLAERAVQATGGVFGTTGTFAEQFSRRVADRTLDAAKESTNIALQAIGNATGRTDGPNSNELLATTVLDKGTATAAIPFLIGWDAIAAAFKDVPAIKDAAYNLWLQLCRVLDPWSSHGVLTGRQRFDADSLIRFGFISMALEGPAGAVARDFRGVVGGVLALGMGDFNWLAKAAKDYWASMEYVYSKWLAGETQPESDFPIGPILAEDAKSIIKRFPRPFVSALESGDPTRVLKAMFEDAGEITTMLSLYPSSAFRVLYDVAVFVIYAWLEVADALDYALCELAIVESDVSDEYKEIALERLRKTAGRATVEFEYYVPLLVPFGGKPSDQALRRSVTGEVMNAYTIAQSVFLPSAIERAQSLHAEVIQLRAFLWLFRDEALAREKSYQETARKFGPKVADRIEQEYREGRSLYPLTPEQIAELMQPDDRSQDVPRTAQEVNQILYWLLRRRGLLFISDLVYAKQPFIAKRAEKFSVDYRPEIAR
jgi:hypothetical protein